MSKKKFKISFIPPAVEDIEEAKYWYNSKQSGFGDEFIEVVETTVDTIQDNPYQFAEKHEHVRQAQTNRFPYLISYIIEKIEIIVLSVLHGSRNPKIFKKRYKERA
jgi:plasmid stabilization system protein ParE